MASINLNWFVQLVVPYLKPEVEAAMVALVNDKANIVAEVNAKLAQGETAAAAISDSLFARMPTTFFFNLVKPELEAAITAEIQDVIGNVTAEDSSWFDAAVAKLSAWEEGVGL